MINPGDHQKGNWVECNADTRYKYPVGFGTVSGLGSGSQLSCPSLLANASDRLMGDILGGRVAVITGSGRGQGLAAALGFRRGGRGSGRQ